MFRSAAGIGGGTTTGSAINPAALDHISAMMRQSSQQGNKARGQQQQPTTKEESVITSQMLDQIIKNANAGMSETGAARKPVVDLSTVLTRPNTQEVSGALKKILTLVLDKVT